jgi:predicted transposase/invertase (TIGR01784 family)
MREFYAPQIAMDMLDAKNEGIAIGEERGIAIGKEEGKLEGLLKTASNLLSMKMSVEQVSQATGLSIEEIKRLQK